MAKPIEPTPVLTGKDAEEFLRELNRAKTTEEINEKNRFLKECHNVHEQLKKCRR